MYKQADRAIAEVAAGQHGLILRSQAMALGMTDTMLHRRLASGALVTARPGVYVLPGHTFTPEMLIRAASYALPGVVSHESAAEIHDLPYVPRGLAVISVPHRTTNRFPEIVVHQSTDLFPHHIEEIDGMRITTVPRTIFDLASRLRLRRVRMIVEQAVVEQKCTLDDLATIKDELARRGRPGSALFRKVLCEIGPGVALSESALELAGMRLLRDAGLPEPRQQLGLPWRDTRDGRVDMAYPEARLIIELDGRRWHSRTETWEMDHKRDRAAQLAGWKVFRFTWSQLEETPGDFIASVAQALAEQGAS
jgi:predicted transcriptional regulator of viral defense system